MGVNNQEKIEERVNRWLKEVGAEFSVEVTDEEPGRGFMDRPFLVEDGEVKFDGEFNPENYVANLVVHDVVADALADKAGIVSPETWTQKDSRHLAEKLDQMEKENSRYIPGDTPADRKLYASIIMRERPEQAEQTVDSFAERFRVLDQKVGEVTSKLARPESLFVEGTPSGYTDFISDFAQHETRIDNYEEFTNLADVYLNQSNSDVSELTEEGREVFRELRDFIPKLAKIDQKIAENDTALYADIDGILREIGSDLDPKLMAASQIYRDSMTGSANDMVKSRDHYANSVTYKPFITSEIGDEVFMTLDNAADLLEKEGYDSQDRHPLISAVRETVQGSNLSR